MKIYLIFKILAIFRVGYCLITYIILKNITPSSHSRNIIHSEKICNIASYVAGMESGTAKAVGTIPLFPILRFKDHPMNKTRVLHEYIHHIQIAESLGLRQLMSIIENIYGRISGKTVMESYLNKATEQEAYLNQLNQNYLKERPLWATWKYFFYKTKFRLENHQVKLVP